VQDEAEDVQAAFEQGERESRKAAGVRESGANFIDAHAEIMENHGYNVINVEEGNHEEIMKRNRCFSALGKFMTTLTETQAGGGQPGAQVAAGNWKKVLKFGDGQWPPEPPHGQVPGWATIPDPTLPQPRAPGPPPGYKAPPQPYPFPPPKARPTPSAPPPKATAAGSQSSSSDRPPPQAEPKPAAKPMPSRRDVPETEFVRAEKPMYVTLYNKVLQDYTGTPVRSKLNIHEENGEFALSHIQGPMANSAQQTWRQYLRRTAVYTCLCFGLANAKAIAETSWAFSDMEWLRIYNAALKRGGMLHQNYYLSVSSMMVMIGKNSDAQATSNGYYQWKRGLMSGIGGTIVERPLVRKEKDELAGKFRYGRTILITDLMYRCQSNAGGMTKHSVWAR